MGGKPRSIVKLRCAVKNYDWGQIGKDSHVARLAETNSDEEVDPTRPYAELWMGTHPSGPSYVVGDEVSLKEWIAENPAVLGQKIGDIWGPDLPFLFKVAPSCFIIFLACF
jgi:mannose-6-phosphate isomerase